MCFSFFKPSKTSKNPKPPKPPKAPKPSKSSKIISPEPQPLPKFRDERIQTNEEIGEPIQIIEEKITKKQIKLGTKEPATGGNGKVYFGVYNNDTSVAVKKFDDAGERYQYEIRILNIIFPNNEHNSHNKHFVHFYGCYKEGIVPCLVFELMPCGDLYDLIYKNKSDFVSMKKKLEIALDVAKGLDVLHTHYKILHRDIKIENILIDENYRAKITDFDLSIEEKDIDRERLVVGTHMCFAPEIIVYSFVERDKRGKPPYSTATDMYAFAVMMIELLSDIESVFRPEEEDTEKLFDYILEGNRPSLVEHCTQPVAHLIEGCWGKKPATRSTANAVAAGLEKIIENRRYVMN